MLYMAKLGPDIITEEINIDDEEMSTETEDSPALCDSVRCQQMLKGKGFLFRILWGSLFKKGEHKQIKLRCNNDQVILWS